MLQQYDENDNIYNRSYSASPRKVSKRRMNLCSPSKESVFYNERSENSYTHRNKLSNSNIEQNLETLQKQFAKIYPENRGGYKDEDQPVLQRFTYISSCKTRNIFQQAVLQLSQHFHPQVVSCRDSQKKAIQKFVRTGIQGAGQRQTLYISGVPGIGKTLCVDQVLKKLQTELRIKQEKELQKNIKSNITEVQMIYLNAMTVKRPQDIFKLLYKRISGFQRNPFNALCYLNDFFQRGSVKMHNGKNLYMKTFIIVIDQFDLLSKKGQDVIYNILQWTQHKNSRLNLIAISNTIDFPETLPPKISSRMGNQRKVFIPYDGKAISKILNQRIEKIPIFDESALQYISKKLAQSTSDIRKCLKILRQSVASYVKQCVKNRQEPKKVTKQDLARIHSLEYDNTFVKNFRYFHPSHRVILKCLAEFSMLNNHEECFYSELYIRCKPHLGGYEGSIRPALQDLRDMGFINMRFSTFKTDRRVERGIKLHKHLQQLCVKLQINLIDSILTGVNEFGIDY